MQVKKTEVYQNILKAAKDEFLLCGYKGASMWRISKKSAVPIGNIYRYFSKKEDLLRAVAGEAYAQVPLIIDDISRKTDLGAPELIVPAITLRVIEIFDAYGDEVNILVHKSAHSKLADFAQKLTEQVTRIFYEVLPADNNTRYNTLSTLLANSFMSALFEIVRMDCPIGEKRNLVSRMIKFFFLDLSGRI